MLVEFNTSGWIRHGDPADFSFLYETGWLLGQDAEHVVLWDAELRIRRLARKPSFPDDWSRLSASHPAGRPLPSEWHEVDFAALCRAAHEDMPADEWGLKDEALKAAVLALWAHQRREWKLRDDLLVTVRARYEAASPVPVLEQLRAGVAANARWRALTDANEGTPRAALLAAWRGIAQLAPQARDGEAGHMVAAYENMLIEDAAHRKPGDAALAEMPAAAQVDVWLHRLRDLAACQRGQPGGCEVFMGGEPSATWAPDALRALGWAAVPGLIARLDDTRPTRSLGYWRNFAPGSYYLLTHADCSRQILYAITGEWFETCADAEAWWREHGEDGAERFLLGQLERGVNMRFAVEQLLARDARAHLSRVAAVLERADATQRIELGGEFARHAGAEHLPLLQSLLACDDPMVCVLRGRGARPSRRTIA